MHPLSDELAEDIFGRAAEQPGPGEDAPTLTAQPMAASQSPDEAYDAVSPDDLAPEWLTRATEAGVMEVERERENAELLHTAGGSMIGEGSLNAADPDQLEADAIAHLEQSDDASSAEREDMR